MEHVEDRVARRKDELWTPLATPMMLFTLLQQISFIVVGFFFISVRQVVVSMWSVVMCVRISMNLQNVYLLQ